MTVFSQHPLRAFDRLRKADRNGLVLPDWRFFAPDPIRYDFALLFRTGTGSDNVTEWQFAQPATCSRQWRHGLWYPEQRLNKALLDVCQSALKSLRNTNPGSAEAPLLILRSLAEISARQTSPSEQLSENMKYPYISTEKMQFAITRYGGFDSKARMEVLYVSEASALWKNRIAKSDRS